MRSRNRHVRDRDLLDREITAGRFKDLPSYVPGGSAVPVLAGRPGRQPARPTTGPENERRSDQAYWCRYDDRFPTFFARYRAST